MARQPPLQQQSLRHHFCCTRRHNTTISSSNGKAIPTRRHLANSLQPWLRMQGGNRSPASPSSSSRYSSEDRLAPPPSGKRKGLAYPEAGPSGAKKWLPCAYSAWSSKHLLQRKMTQVVIRLYLAGAVLHQLTMHSTFFSLLTCARRTVGVSMAVFSVATVAVLCGVAVLWYNRAVVVVGVGGGVCFCGLRFRGLRKRKSQELSMAEALVRVSVMRRLASSFKTRSVR